MTIGATFGKSTPHRTKAVITNKATGLFDFVMAGNTLCQIEDIVIESSITLEDAKKITKGDKRKARENVIATLEIIGQVNGDVSRRNHPIMPGTLLKKASTKAICKFLRMPEEGIKVGELLRRRDVPIGIDKKTFDSHISILGKTGKGKSHTSKVLLSQMSKWGDVRIIVIDPHAEYEGKVIRVDNIGLENCKLTLSQAMRRFREEMPKSFDKTLQALEEIVEWDNEDEVKSWKSMTIAQKIITISDDEFFTGGTRLKKKVEKILMAEATNSLLRRCILKQDSNEPLIICLNGVDKEQAERIVGLVAELVLEEGKKGNGRYLFIDEAHRYVPQRGSVSSKAPIINISQEGRKFNCGMVIMSQRPAKVDKDVISQCNTMFCLNITQENDIKQVRASTEWATRQMFQEVQKLQLGEALMVSTAIERPIFIKVDKYV